MNFKDYIPLAMRTLSPLADGQQHVHAQLGLITEVGELADTFKRNMAYGQALDYKNILEECGDILWYLALVYHDSGNDVPDTGSEEFKQSMQEMLGISADPAVVVTALAHTIGNGPIDGEASALASLWTISVLLKSSGFTLEQAMEVNLLKLAKRHGDKFSEFNAINRDLVLEQALLEAAAVRSQQ